MESFEGEGEQGESGEDEGEGAEFGFRFLKGPLADEGGGEIESEIDDDVIPVVGPSDAEPGKTAREVNGVEVPGEERKVNDGQEGERK